MKRHVTAAVALAGLLLLAGCGATSANDEPNATPIPTKSSTPTPTPTLEASESGTRANPLPVGQSRKISDESMWSVGAESATEVHDGYVVLPLRIDLDWEAYKGQGGSPDEDGADPWASLIVDYVSAAGRTYDTNNRPPEIVSNELWEVGTVYPPTTTVSTNVAIAVPADEVPGGVWKVSNLNNDAVFIVGAP